MRQAFLLGRLVLCTLLSASCATNYVTDKAKPQTQYDEKQKQDVVIKKGHPAFYALLPLSVPVDVVTFPVQVVVFSCWPGPKASDCPQLTPINFIQAN